MLEVRRLRVTYGDLVAVADVDLTVAAGEVVCLLGPSGCGKSSLLRAVAGLEPATGRIHLDGRDITTTRPDRRGIGLMFQDQALFPHRDVAGNVGFGPRMRGWDRHDVDARVAEVLELVGLSGYGPRRVDELSGGQRQRVALARALAPRPRLLMLDEPLASLDRALRDQLLDEFPRVFAEAGAGVVYVTHDQDEALALADRVLLMRAGQVVQEGPPDELWRRPATAFVARFLGLKNLLDSTVHAGTAVTPLGPVPADGTRDGSATVALLPDALALSRPEDGDASGRVLSRRFAGDHFVVAIRTAEGVDLEVPVSAGRPPKVGERVGITFDPGAAVVLEDEG